MNPMALMHLKPMLEQFRDRHPKFVQFFGYAGSHLTEDSLLEISITDAEGKKIVTNMRVTPEDLEMYNTLQNLLQG